MTVYQQLHKSGFHKGDIDPRCPACNPLIAIIRDLERCAIQNEKDSKAGSSWEPPLDREARAVASEQRRMLKILKEVSDVYGVSVEVPE